ncbi:MAG TPA: hypothetical protein VGM82_10980 [Gemmatimonadaceae bacterium]|jgi:hypothetical protein
MRTRAASLFVMLALPAALSAQILRIPRRGTPPPAPLPPTAEPVARALRVQQSRWSGEAYSLFSSVRVPGANGGSSNYATFGGGTHGGYRLNDRFTGTADITTSMFGSPINSSTVEVGTRFMPMPFDIDIRPFVDVRASYMYLSDTFTPQGGVVAGNDYQISRYGRGFGGITGAGFEYSLTNSFALSTELSALRGRMTAYHIDNPTSIPVGNSYWMTAYRLTVGFKYAGTRVSQLREQTK